MGGFWNEALKGAQQGLGESAPYLLGGWAAGGTAAYRAPAQWALQQAGRVGVAGAGDLVNTVGGAYMDVQQRIQAAEAAGDPAHAEELRQGRDAYVVALGLTSLAIQRLSPLQKVFPGGSRSLLGAPGCRDVYQSKTNRRSALKPTLPIGYSYLMRLVSFFAMLLFASFASAETTSALTTREKGEKEMRVEDGATDPKTQSLLRTIHDTTANPAKRHKAFVEMADQRFRKGSSMLSLSKLLSQLKLLKPTDYVSVMASTGPPLFPDEGGLAGQNRVVAFTLHWNATSSTVVYLLLDTRLILLDDLTEKLFSGNWSPDWPGTLRAVSLSELLFASNDP